MSEDAELAALSHGARLAHEKAKWWNDKFQRDREELEAARLRHPSAHEKGTNGNHDD